MNEAVVKKALSLVGQGYIYGAKGQTCSPAFRAQQAEQYPEWSDNILNVGAKWDGKPVWDCAQLTRAVAKEGGVTLVSGATSQWEKTDWEDDGTIDTIPEGETVMVFRRKDGKMQHTGVALGDGTCVHARGTAYGVVRQKMSEHAWTHWALPSWKEKKLMDRTATVFAKSGNTVRLRKEPNDTSDVIQNVIIGTEVGVLRGDAFWKEIVLPSGQTGWMMGGFVREKGQETVSSAVPEEMISVPKKAVVTLYNALLEVMRYVNS